MEQFVTLSLPSKEAVEQEYGEELTYEAYLDVIETVRRLVEDQVDTCMFIPEALELANIT